MPFPRWRVRTLMIAVASVAIGFASAPRTYFLAKDAWSDGGPFVVAQHTTAQIIATGLVISVIIYAVVYGATVLKERMTTRQQIVVMLVALVLFALICRRQYMLRLAEYHEGLTVRTARPDYSANGNAIPPTIAEE